MSVVVVGSANLDVVARVARIPAPGETVLASGLRRSGGGKGANQAVAAARAGGAEVAFVGAVGDDAGGAELREGMRADGIDVAGLETADAPTGTALISVDDDGENAIVVVAGANGARTQLSESQSAIVAGARVLVTQLEVPVPLVRAAAAARADRAWHVLNAAPSSPLTGDGATLLADVDVLVVNEHELRDIADVEGFDDAVGALAARLPALVVTLGSRGCLVVVSGDRRMLPAHPVRAVDTTGAGDTFCGVFAASLARSGALPGDGAVLEVFAEAARVAGAAAALAVERPGAQDAVPTAAEVADLIARSGESR